MVARVGSCTRMILPSGFDAEATKKKKEAEVMLCFEKKHERLRQLTKVNHRMLFITVYLMTGSKYQGM